MRQLSRRLADDLAYLIEVLLERFKTDEVIHDEATASILILTHFPARR
jgi:hypothetical protein